MKELTELSSDRLLQTLIAEMVANKADIIPLELDMATLFAITVQVQFALRDPINTGASANLARKFVEIVQEGISESYPAVAESIRRGWLGEYDLSREELQP